MISGSGWDGIDISGAGNDYNWISGNLIGTDKTGTVALGGNHYGVRIDSGASDNIIGTNGDGNGDAFERNVISGNQWSGVYFTDAGTTGNTVAGNLIGIDTAGTTPVPNLGEGITLNIASGNTIGGDALVDRNIISGNGQRGIGSYTATNVIAGNYIGLDVSGRGLGQGAVAWYKADGNTDDSINHLQGTLEGNASFAAGEVGQAFMFVGGSDELLANNSATGPLDITADQITVEGWVYQTAAAQTGNPWDLQAIAGKWYDTANKGYLLETVNGRLAFGIVTSNGRVDDIAATSLPLNTWVHVAGTYDGQTIRIFADGVLIASAAQTGNILHSVNDFSIGNLFTGASWRGRIDELTVYSRALSASELAAIADDGTSGKPNALGNSGDGIALINSSNNTIGGSTDAARNVISGNKSDGVYLSGQGATGNTVAGNYIGTSADGSAAIGNGYDGIAVDQGAAGNLVGTSGVGHNDIAERNVISGNKQDGVGLFSDGNVVAGNYIGTDASGSDALGNGQTGVYIIGSGNRVGINGADSDAAAERNVISGNTNGVYISGSALGVGGANNIVAGNLIGTTATGAAALGNMSFGVGMAYGASANRIGTDGDGQNDGLEGNVIAANRNGVTIVFGAHDNSVAGNLIGTDISGTVGLGNLLFGVSIGGAVANWAAPSGNRIGVDGADTDPQAERNVISGNAGAGVLIDSSGTDNWVSGNLIGTDETGTIALGNKWHGVIISSQASQNIIGTNGDGRGDALERNVISGNQLDGVYISDAGTNSNIVAGNYVGSDATGTAAIANAEYGLVIANGAKSNRVGADGADTDAAAEDNLISGNGYGGVEIVGAGTNSNWILTPSQVLYKIDPTSGATQHTAPLHTSDNSAFPTLNALAFRADGQLFAAGGGSVFEVNTATGLLTPLPVTLAGGEQSAGDLVFDRQGDMFITTLQGDLIEMPSGYSTSSVVVSGLPTDLFGMVAASDTQFVAFSEGSDKTYEIDVDPSTGQASVIVGPTVSGGAGLPAGIYGACWFHRVIPTIDWSNPADITYGTKLGATQLDATANTPGSFSYTLADNTTSASGVVLNAAPNQTLNVTFTPTDATHYTTTTAQVEINVEPAPLTITANDQTMAYGGALPTLTVNYSGLVNGDTPTTFESSPNTAPTVSAPAKNHAGSYAGSIVASGAVDADYAISYVPGKLTVTAAALTITADDQTMVYGGTLPALTATYSGLVNGDTPGTFSSSPNTAPTVSAPAKNHVGSYTGAVVPSGAVDDDYTISYVPGKLTVTPAALTITANDQTMVYGGTLPALTVTYSGLVNGDTPATFSGSPNKAPTVSAPAKNHAGSYAGAVVPSGAVDDDYTISYVPGKLTVTPAALTITADDQTMVYGGTLPTLAVSYSGLVNGDTPATFSSSPNKAPTVSAPATDHVGSYAGAVVPSGAVDDDYTISYVPGKLTVTPAALTISANDQTMVYGGMLPALTVTYSGLVNGDLPATFGVSPNTAPTVSAPAKNHAGSYAGAIVASGAVDADYAISYVPGKLTVTPAPLTVTADDQTMVYGGTLPTLTVSYSGLVNGDTPATFSVSPNTAPTVSAPANNHAGRYAGAIVASGAVDADYTISYVPGKLTVTAAALAITADDQTMVYGGTLPALTVSYSGLVNGDTPATFSSSPNAAPAVTAPANNHAGSYAGAIVASGAVDVDYTISYVPGKLTVTAAALTITANDQTMVYGGTLPTLTVSYSGLVNGDTAAMFNSNPNKAPSVSVPATNHVGSYAGAIVASGAVDDDYTISYVPGKLAVTPAALTITADDQTMVYGGAPPALTASYSGLVNSDTPATFSSSPNAAPAVTAPANNHVGSYAGAIVASGAVDADYTISYVPGKLTVTPAALTITANDQTMVYGGALPALTASYSGLVDGDTPAKFGVSPNTAPTVTAPATNHVGSYASAIVASGAVDADYTISYVPGKLTVTPAALTITANDQTMVYGGTLPALTVSYSGLVNGDLPATFSVSTNIAPTVAAPAKNHVGSYVGAIVASGAVDADYTITYISGKLTVRAAALTITSSDQTMVYGGTLPALTVSYNGLVNGDTSAMFGSSPNVAPTVNAPATNHVGSYVGAIVASGAVDADYTITYVAGKLTVTPAALTITADDQTMVYGGALPALTVSYGGLVNGDTPATFSTAPTVTAPAKNHLGSYVGAIVASGAVDADYTITYVPGKLTVTPAALAITANDQTMVYGGTLPALTVSYSGLINGDTPATFSSSPNKAPSVSAPATNHVGSYAGAIVASGAVDADYTITYVPGKLTVTPAPLTITADDKSKVCGAALPALTASYSGFVNGDTAASLTTAPTLSTAATANSHVSGNPYTIAASGAVDPDYTISYVAGSLTVTPAALTITADDNSKVYGAALPALTASYSGLVNGDTAASLTTQPTLSTAATGGSQVSGSPYAITASGATDADYTISYVAGTLTVRPAALTITADDKSKVYGAALPLLTASYSGFVNGDTAASLTTQPTLSAAATAGSHVSGSPYTITVGGAADPDYTISYIAGALTVTPATLTVTASDASKVQGAANPTFSDTISGFVNGDGPSVVSGAASLTTTATTTSAVGSYPITTALGTLSAADYNFAFQNGTLTVTSPTPFVVNDAVYTIGSGTVSVSAAAGLLANDTGPTHLSVTAGTVTGGQGGTFVFNADGSFTYTPPTNFPGYDSAPFTVSDASGDKATQMVTVLSQHAAVVWKFYESVLNRTPDPAGLAYWTNYFNGGGQTGDMAVGFFESDELLDKIITNYYQQYLLRTPDASGTSFWVGEWQATGEPEGIKAGFADSPEFYKSAGGTPSSWLTALYERILSRTPDPAGFQFWLNYYQQQTAAGTDSGTVEQQIAIGFFESAEAYGDDVKGWFTEYLGRNPTPGEQSQYASQMEAGATDRTIEQEITNLPEYANNPPAPPARTAAPLANYYQTPASSASSQAVVAAKDAVFSRL